jgi:hypothetical protein
MSTNANGKRDRDPVLIAALARGASYTEVARVAGLSKATVARRMAESEFPDPAVDLLRYKFHN